MNYLWPLSLGGMSSGLWLSQIVLFIIAEATVVDLFWAWSPYAMPIVGSVFGWWLCSKTTNKSLQPTANASAE